MSTTNSLHVMCHAKCASHVSGPFQRLQGGLRFGGARSLQAIRHLQATQFREGQRKFLGLVVSAGSAPCCRGRHRHNQTNFLEYLGWQLEAMGLISRRVQAYMEIPSRLGQCRTPQDFANEQARFWQTALTQYSEGSQRLMSAWGQMVASPIGIGGGAGETKRDRDYLTFPEPKAASTAPASTQRPARERRVA